MSGKLLVTGGSRGIGAAVCRLAAARGYGVCVNYRDRDAEARALVETITGAGGQAIAVKADVAREDEVSPARCCGPAAGVKNANKMLDLKSPVGA